MDRDTGPDERRIHQHITLCTDRLSLHVLESNPVNCDGRLETLSLGLADQGPRSTVHLEETPCFGSGVAIPGDVDGGGPLILEGDDGGGLVRQARPVISEAAVIFDPKTQK